MRTITLVGDAIILLSKAVLVHVFPFGDAFEGQEERGSHNLICRIV